MNSVIGVHVEDFAGLKFQLKPSIQTHTGEDHRLNAQAAAVLFETARVLAEMAGGTILQESLLNGCAADNGDRPSRVLAVYPEQPLLYEALCLGFREALGHGVRQISESAQE